MKIKNKDISNWNNNGYIIISGLFDEILIESAKDEIWMYLNMDSSNPDDWYNQSIRNLSGIDNHGRIPMYHGNIQWKCRSNKSILQLFKYLYGENDLCVSFDRANMNPPTTDRFQCSGFLHWDKDIRVKNNFYIQGLLSLTDTSEQGGGFQCVPGFHTIKNKWIENNRISSDGRFPLTTENLKVENIPVTAGDFILWNDDIIHGITPNFSTTPRLALYITYFPRSYLSKEQVVARHSSLCFGTAPPKCSSSSFPESRSIQTHPELSNLSLSLI